MHFDLLIFLVYFYFMNDVEKIKAAITMLKQLKRMVGFFMKKEISELILKLEENNCLDCGRIIYKQEGTIFNNKEQELK